MQTFLSLLAAEHAGGRWAHVRSGAGVWVVQGLAGSPAASNAPKSVGFPASVHQGEPRRRLGSTHHECRPPVESLSEFSLLATYVKLVNTLNWNLFPAIFVFKESLSFCIYCQWKEEKRFFNCVNEKNRKNAHYKCIYVKSEQIFIKNGSCMFVIDLPISDCIISP